jgi:uncharacterized protein YndB with AHSA1/START domain
MASQDHPSPRPDDHPPCTETLDAPLLLAFRVWEQAERMIRWLGPTGFTCTRLEFDFRPGGAWRALIDSETHGRSWMGGEFHSIEREGRIVYTFAWHDGREQPAIETLITATFSEHDGQLIPRFRQDACARQDRDRDRAG